MPWHIGPDGECQVLVKSQEGVRENPRPIFIRVFAKKARQRRGNNLGLASLNNIGGLSLLRVVVLG